MTDDGAPITDLAFLGAHDEDGDVCRVCRVEGDAEMPLIHPCKCSGSVRYVHSDCLKSWLSHTQKRHCEICGYSYTFTKVYPESLPSVIPLIVYFRQAVFTIGRGVAYALHLCLVIQTWLIILPAMNMASLTAMLVTAGYLAPSGGSLGLDKSAADATVQANASTTMSILSSSLAPDATNTVVGNETLAKATLSFVNETMPLTKARWTLSSMVLDPVGSILGEIWFLLRRLHNGDNKALFTYVFRGQVLTLLLAGLLISIVFLREWVLQHDWSQHLPKPKAAEDEIKPEDWVVLGGVAMDQAEYKKRVKAVKVLHKAQTRNARKALNKTKADLMIRPASTNEADGQSQPIGPVADAVRNDAPNADLILQPNDSAVEQPKSVGSPMSGPAQALPTDIPFTPTSPAQENAEALDDANALLETSVPRVGQIGPFLPSRRTSLPVDVQRPGPTVNPGEDSSASLPLPLTSSTSSQHPPRVESPRQNHPTIPSSGNDQPAVDPPATARPPLESRSSAGRRSPPRLIDLSFDGPMPEAGPSRITIPELRASLAEARLSPGEKSGYDLNWQAPELLSTSSTNTADRRSTSFDPLPRSGDLDNPSMPTLREMLDDPSMAPLPRPLERDFRFLTHARAPWASSSTDSSPSITSDGHGFPGHEDELPDPITVDPSIPAEREHIEEHIELFNQPSNEPSTESVDGPVHEPVHEPLIEPLDEIADNLGQLVQLEEQQQALRQAINENRALRIAIARHVRGRQRADRVHGVPAEELDDDDDEEPGDAGDVDREDEDAEVDGQVDAPLFDHLADENMEDAAFEREDWDGVLEIIGMIGPLTNLLQNFFIAQLIMSSALTLLVGLPMIVGKAFLYTDFARVAITIFQLAFKGAQVITGPVPGIAWEIGRDVVLIPLKGSLRALRAIVTRELGLAEIRPPVDPATSAWLVNIMGDFAAGFQGHFVTIFRHVVHAHEAFRTRCANIAGSDSLGARITSIVAGYGFTLLLLLVIAASADDHSGMLSEIMARRLRIYALFVKLSFFMMIELVVFPLAIGLAINLFTLPLFPAASIRSRIDFFQANPIGGLVINLLCGTLFMFSFAGALQHVRRIARPGALFFIRDPADPDYSPVREIIERPARSQIRKLGNSALMYVFIVFCIFGVAVWGLYLQPWWKVLPLRIERYPPLSSVPFDLLFLHLAVPPIMNRIGPRARLRRISNWTYRSLATSFLLYPLLCARSPTQHRSAIEESRVPAKFIWPAFDLILRPVFGKYDPTEGLFRVPGSDKTVLLPAAERGRHGVFVPLDTLGRPRTPEGKLTLLKQNRAATKVGREPQKDYHVVWLPRYWRTRIYMFLFSIVGLSGLGVAVTFFTPLLVGRAALGLLWTTQAHDGYAILVGGGICCFAYVLGQVAKRQIISWLRAPRLRRSEMSRRVKRFILRNLVGCYSFMALYVIVPTLLGMIWEIHISIPWRELRHAGSARILHVWDAWAIGVVQLSLLITISPLFLPRVRRGEKAGRIQLLCRLLRNPFRFKFGTINRVVLPIIGVLLLPLVLPVILTICLLPVLKHSEETLHSVIFPLAFPLVSFAVELYVFRRSFKRRLGIWKRQMIDAEYVLEERVENYEPAAADKEENGSAEETGGKGDKQKKVGNDVDEWEDVSEDDIDQPNEELEEDAHDTTQGDVVVAQNMPHRPDETPFGDHAEVPFDTTWDDMVVESLDGDVSDAASSSKTGGTVVELEEGEEIRFGDGAGAGAVEERREENGDGDGNGNGVEK